MSFLTTLKAQYQVIAKGDSVPYDYHSVQANLYDVKSDDACSLFYRVRNLVPQEAVYRELPQVFSSRFNCMVDDPNEEYGKETTPHVTLLYGLVNENDFFPVFKTFSQIKTPTFKVGKLSSFRNPNKPYDVLVVEIASPDFHNINKVLRTFKNENKYPEYKPHMTLSYIKKGTCTELEGNHVWVGQEYQVPQAVWCHKDRLKLPLAFKAL